MRCVKEQPQPSDSSKRFPLESSERARCRESHSKPAAFIAGCVDETATVQHLCQGYLPPFEHQLIWTDRQTAATQ